MNHESLNTYFNCRCISGVFKYHQDMVMTLLLAIKIFYSKQNYQTYIFGEQELCLLKVFTTLTCIAQPVVSDLLNKGDNKQKFYIQIFYNIYRWKLQHAV